MHKIASAIGHSSDDELSAISGSHTLRLRTEPTSEITVVALQTIQARGARLDGVNVSKSGTSNLHRYSIVGLGPSAAKQLLCELSTISGVEWSNIEHGVDLV